LERRERCKRKKEKESLWIIVLKNPRGISKKRRFKIIEGVLGK